MAKVALCFLLLFVVLVSLEVVQGAGGSQYSSSKSRSRSHKNQYSSGGGKGSKSGSTKYEKQSSEEGDDGGDESDSGKGESSRYKKMDKYQKKEHGTTGSEYGKNMDKYQKKEHGTTGSEYGKNMNKYQKKEYRTTGSEYGKNMDKYKKKEYGNQESEYGKRMDKYQGEDYSNYRNDGPKHDGGYSQYGGENSRGLEKRVDRMEDTVYDLKREMHELTVKVKLLLKLKLNIKLILKLKVRIETIEETLALMSKELAALTVRTKKCCRKPRFHGIPKTCQDIYESGAQNSGFYMVQDEDLKAVYCNFEHACKGNVTQINIAIIVTIKIKVFVSICLRLLAPWSVTAPTHIMFNDVISNQPDNAYDSATGNFYPPTDGVYLFSCIFIKAVIKVDVIIQILINLKLEATVKAVLSLADLSTLTLAHQVFLKAGVEVILKLTGALGIGSHCCQISLLQDNYTPIGGSGSTY